VHELHKNSLWIRIQRIRMYSIPFKTEPLGRRKLVVFARIEDYDQCLHCRPKMETWFPKYVFAYNKSKIFVDLDFILF